MAETLENTTVTDRIFPASNPLRPTENNAHPALRQTTGEAHSMRSVLVQNDVIMSLDIRELLSRLHRMEVMGQHPHCNQVLKLIKGLRPDLVALDITTPSQRSLGALQSIRRLYSCGISILLFERFPCVDPPRTAEHAYRFAYRFAYYQPARIGPTVRPIFVLQPELYGVLSPHGH
jgi:hypothetical protein